MNKMQSRGQAPGVGRLKLPPGQKYLFCEFCGFGLRHSIAILLNVKMMNCLREYQKELNVEIRSHYQLTILVIK
jgi:hypothetical protein